jgi:cell division protein FtsW (lipid II flippase)/cell division protein FtsI/penicillin-binding protein 2
VWLFLFFVLPLILVGAAWAWQAVREYEYRRGLMFVTLVPVSIAAAGIAFLVAKSSHWHDSKELVWLASESTLPDNVLVLGGNRGGTGLGWPTGFSWPQVKLSAAGEAITMEIRGGGGAVVIDGEVANGQDLGVSDVTIRGFRIRLANGWFGKRRVEIRSASAITSLEPASVFTRWVRRFQAADADPPLVSFAPPMPPSHMISLSGRVARAVFDLRRRNASGDLALALALEEWASSVRLHVTDAKIRALDEADTTALVSVTTKGPTAAIEVRWPRRVLRGSIGQLGSRLQFRFAPPWTQSSPLPPSPPKGESTALTLTNVPAPGDVVFALPFGREHSVRTSVRIVQSPERGPLFEQEAGWTREPIVPPGTSRSAQLRTYAIARVQSDTCVTVETARPCLAIVEDVLRPRPLAIVLVMALLALVIGVTAAEPLVRDLPQLAWTLVMLLAAFWNLLGIRLVLALRAALDPAGLDAMAVRSVADAVIVLVAVPPCLAGCVAVYRERFFRRDAPARRRRFWYATTALPVILLGAYFSSRAALRLWPNLPERFEPSFVSGSVALLVALGVAGMAAILFYVLLPPEVRKEHPVWDFLVNWHLRLLSAGGRVWSRSQRLDAPKPLRFWSKGCVLLGLVLACFAATARVSEGLKIITELLFPLVVGVGTIIFWIGALHGFPSARRVNRDPPPSWRTLIGLAFVFALVPSVAPVAFGDPGALYAMLGTLLVTGLLLVTSRQPRFGAAIIGACLTVALLLTLLTTHVSILGSAIGWFDRGVSRITAYMEGLETERMLPLARMQSDAGDGLPADALRGALEHPWEARAIVYRGNWTGAGFGAAPTRRSNIPQDVLQFDSTMAFFVAGDHGLLGVFALFLLYLVPLATLLAGTRRTFDTGYAVAIAIAASLVVEAVVHTTVNLGVLPFTGRNLPWLSVQSNSDLFRWTAMAFLIVQASLWRTTGSEFRLSDDVELVTEPLPQAPAGITFAGLGPLAGISTVATIGIRDRVATGLMRLAPAGMGPLLTMASTVGLLVIGFVVVPGIVTIHAHSYAEPFTWRLYFDQVERYLIEHKIRWDAATWTLDPSPLKNEGIVLDGSSLLEQEIARFNALPREAKSELPESLRSELRAVRTVADYDRLLLRAAERDRRRERLPISLFRVEEEAVHLDNGTSRIEEIPVVDRTLDASVNFGEDEVSSSVPTVRYRTSAGGQQGPQILGPAWISGRTRTVFAPDQRLPWGQSLAAAISSVWSSRKFDGVRDRFSKVTLDAVLQDQATAFVATKGRHRHSELLAMGLQSATPTLALPPRVALSIVALPTGQVLAMGGWPALSASNTWQTDANGVAPPAHWLETRAPRPLARRYLGERNFDPIEMGSATKPLWAAATLRVHSKLARALRTRGPEEEEEEVFGIHITNDGWTTHARDWTPFRTYMAVSDNRYHVRLGFLGLAEDANGLPIPDTRTRSNRESLSVRNGSEVVWERAPRFEPAIGFSASSPHELHDVHTVRLATELRQMFGISVRSGDYRLRRQSFWSLDDADDREDHAALPSAFGSLSPVVPAFRLEALTSPRDYVTLLLGGGNNRWANVDFAAAFATVVTGHPVLSRMVGGDVKIDAQARPAFDATAAQMRDALRDVVLNGTAAPAFGPLATWFHGHGVAVYGKTGTLSTDKGRTDTSRLVVALIRWRDESRGEVAGGVVLSLVAERAETGVAARWLSEFVGEHRDVLLRYVQASAKP